MWTTVWVVLLAIGVPAAAGGGLWALKRHDKRRLARAAETATRNGHVTVAELQRREILRQIDAANRAETVRLSQRDAARREREAYALAAEYTQPLPGVRPAPGAEVPHQRPAVRSRPYIEQRAAVGRGGER
ncbi:hypothetical protein [Amycolatopsis kentuckyensis]|uniref:hypothetical protein n=1 Tax=Amycolatopsis kentuckyensis TaxID=218823 RepID=UPI003566BCAB